MKAIALIPARYASTRFPGKPLALLGGKAVILHVCGRVSLAGILPVVATDDQRIFNCVTGAGYKAVMTSADHRSGTDRIREALDKLGDTGVDVIINVQGDEPFIRPEQLESLRDLFADPEVKIATLIKKFKPEEGFGALENPNLVKVVKALNGDALYFSRSVIPYVRGAHAEEWCSRTDFFTHIGVYAYRPDILRQVTQLAPTPHELAESLEQNRWLDNGYRIRTLVTEGSSVGIDTPADLAEAEKLLHD